MKRVLLWLVLVSAVGLGAFLWENFPERAPISKTKDLARAAKSADESSPGTVVARSHARKIEDPVPERPVVRTVPKAPSPLDQPSAEELRRFPGAKVLQAAEVEGPGPGQTTIVRILDTNFKYPHIRTEEIVDGSTGQVLTREEMVADHILVTLLGGESPSALLDRLNLTTASLVAVSPDPNVALFRLHLPEASLEAVPTALAALDKTTGGVVSAEPDFIRQGLLVPNDPKFQDGTLWGLNQRNDADIDAPEGWDLRTSATNIVVAVIDTGVRYTHEDLAGNIWTNPNEVAGNGIDDDTNGYVDDVHGIDACNIDADPMDDHGHGTHCSGTIGATGNNGIGLTGVAWGVRLMALKFLDDQGSGTDSDAVVCIDYARIMGAKVMSCSWGGGGPGESLRDAIERARTAGVIMVAAAGNESNNNDLWPSYPASYPHDNIVSVASTTSSDQLSYFSNFGATSVDLGAPGSSIYSTVADSDQAYDTYSGTSMATPHVAGVLALLAAHYPADTYTDLVSRLLNGTDRIRALSGKAKAGRLNLAKALVSSSIPPVVRPLNDNLAAAAVVNGASWSQTGTTLYATAQKGEPTHAGQTPASSVWYRWTAPGGGVATLSTEGSSFDTVLAVYTGSKMNALTRVAENDNPPAGGTKAAVSFPAVAGRVYRIAVDGKGGASGNFNLTGEFAEEAPANDAFAAAEVLGRKSSFSRDATNLGATGEAGEPNHALVSGQKSVWWSWTAPTNGQLVVDTKGSNYDTVLAIYAGSRVDQLSLLAANDDGPLDVSSRVSIQVQAGQTYRIAVDGYSGDSGFIRLNGKLTLPSSPGRRPPSASRIQATVDHRGWVRATWVPADGARFYEATIRSATRTHAIFRTSEAGVSFSTSLLPAESAVITVRAYGQDMDPGLPSAEIPLKRIR